MFEVEKGLSVNFEIFLVISQIRLNILQNEVNFLFLIQKSERSAAW